ncbi:MAG TPA: multiubiquitin domain-containing protein [Candidatus Saccharimonadales bacterium]|jgi:hypothetical protein|nr:multiubiquitin domain-containing protein [Candidatus Saccharimonadales bacterium]
MSDHSIESQVQVEEVEIEVFAKRGEKPPPAKRFIIRVDKEKFVVKTETITGVQILALAGKTPEKFKLYELKRGHQPILIEPNTVVDLREEGVERFTTMAKDTTEGAIATNSCQYDFKLPLADEDYLCGLGLPWETVRNDGTMWLLVHRWKLPPGYNVEFASVGLLIPPGYADSQIDMVYFQPQLNRADGRVIGALSTQMIAGNMWQRWSRHRTQQNPWRPGIDDIAAHLSLVDEWLRREFLGGRN